MLLPFYLINQEQCVHYTRLEGGTTLILQVKTVLECMRRRYCHSSKDPGSISDDSWIVI